MTKKKQKAYSVGPDELCVDAPDNVDILVYWYENHGYDGNGIAVFRNAGTKKWWDENLSHCSCYGPIEGGLHGDMTWRKILKLTHTDEAGLKRIPDDCDFDQWDAIGKKLRALHKRGTI